MAAEGAVYQSWNVAEVPVCVLPSEKLRVNATVVELVPDIPITKTFSACCGVTNVSVPLVFVPNLRYRALRPE